MGSASKEADAGSDGVQVVFKSLTGESLTEIRVKTSWTVGHIAGMLAERVPLPARKTYQLVYGVEPLSASDALSLHAAGDSIELIACAESDDSSDESGGKAEASGKAKKDTKAKSKKSKKKDKKSKKKDKKSSKKKGKSSSSASDGPSKKKSKKQEKNQNANEAADGSQKSEWIAERLDELRAVRPPLPLELCLVRAQKEWAEKVEAAAAEKAQAEEDKLPDMVREAMQLAGEEATKAGKSEDEVKVEIDKARHFSLIVAKQNGLCKDDPDDEDPSKVPLYFQKRQGLEKAMNALERQGLDRTTIAEALKSKKKA